MKPLAERLAAMRTAAAHRYAEATVEMRVAASALRALDLIHDGEFGPDGRGFAEPFRLTPHPRAFALLGADPNAGFETDVLMSQIALCAELEGQEWSRVDD
jgi:hypothetical protein